MSDRVKPWGIALKWDEDGLECCIWAHHRRFPERRLEFVEQQEAHKYITGVLYGQLAHPYGGDIIATPRQFG